MAVFRCNRVPHFGIVIRPGPGTVRFENGKLDTDEYPEKHRELIADKLRKCSAYGVTVFEDGVNYDASLIQQAEEVEADILIPPPPPPTPVEELLGEDEEPPEAGINILNLKGGL
jgi:hypothetical protein